MAQAQIPPGGLIPSGMGGRVYAGNLDVNLNQAMTGIDLPPGVLATDVGRWSLQARAILAECPHSGCYGAIARRVVAYDWRATLSIPYDYLQPPDINFNAPQSVAVRFNIGDVDQDPLLASQNFALDQQFYVAPSAFLEAVQPVLDGAGRDVVRIDLSLAGNSLIFRLPAQLDQYTDYKNYLVSRGWLT